MAESPAHLACSRFQGPNERCKKKKNILPDLTTSVSWSQPSTDTDALYGRTIIQQPENNLQHHLRPAEQTPVSGWYGFPQIKVSSCQWSRLSFLLAQSFSVNELFPRGGFFFEGGGGGSDFPHSFLRPHPPHLFLFCFVPLYLTSTKHLQGRLTSRTSQKRLARKTW